MSNRADIQSIREWFSQENYQANVKFNAAQWAAQICRRYKIKQSLESKKSTDSLSKRLTERIHELQTDPLGVPDWVKQCCGLEDASSSVHPLTFGDIRDMLGYWRGQFSYDEPEETPPLNDNDEEQHGNDHEESENNEDEQDDSNKAPPVDSDSSQLIWNALPDEDLAICDKLFANFPHWDTPNLARVVIDLQASNEKVIEDLDKHRTMLREHYKQTQKHREKPEEYYNFSEPLADTLQEFHKENHSWVKYRVLEYFDIYAYCKQKGLLMPSHRNMLDLLNVNGEDKVFKTIKDKSNQAIRIDTWFALLSQVKS